MSQKIALCFIINYEHVLYKEDLWREWIEPNKDIINVYFFYKDLKKIRSKWIYERTIPDKFICNTSYYHVIPAYFSIIRFALLNDKKNKWFCYLTDSCCPIISPEKFRTIFENNYNQSVMKYSRAHWNINIHHRANLALLPKEYHLANDPWFILTREHAVDCMNYAFNERKLCNLICQGGLANESLFAIILKHFNRLENVKSEITHIADWLRMSSPTSPHLFIDGNEEDIKFIENNLKSNKYVMFIRKVHPKFPDEILKKYIYEKDKENITNTNFYLKNVLLTKIMAFFLGTFICGLLLKFHFYTI